LHATHLLRVMLQSSPLPQLAHSLALSDMIPHDPYLEAQAAATKLVSSLIFKGSNILSTYYIPVLSNIILDPPLTSAQSTSNLIKPCSPSPPQAPNTSNSY
jgi:hypothetical protein